MSSISMCYWDKDQDIDSDGKLYSASVPYFVFDCADEDAALAYAYENIPATLTYNNSSLKLSRIGIERIAETKWKVVAQYPYDKSNGSTDTDEPEFSFEVSADTKHILYGLQTITSMGPSGTLPSFANAINVKPDGEIEGCDIVKGQYSFSEKHYYSNSKMTTAFKKKISELVGKVNNESFKGWSAGEVLFMGASGSRRGKKSSDKWEVTFRFNVNPNRTGVTVGGISVGAVDGWDYLWVQYNDDVASNQKTKVAKQACVERVYERASFSDLA